MGDRGREAGEGGVEQPETAEPGRHEDDDQQGHRPGMRPPADRTVPPGPGEQHQLDEQRRGKPEDAVDLDEGCKRKADAREDRPAA